MEVWNQIQDKMVNNQLRSGSYSAKNIYALSGLVMCGECGATYIGTTSRPRKLEYSYYLCGTKERKSGTCSSKMIPKNVLEEKVVSEIENNLFTGPGREQMINDINEANRKTAIDLSVELKRLENEKQKIVGKITNLIRYDGRRPG